MLKYGICLPAGLADNECVHRLWRGGIEAIDFAEGTIGFEILGAMSDIGVSTLPHELGSWLWDHLKEGAGGVDASG